LRKTPYALCRSCRGKLDLQLFYSNLGALQFNFWRKQQSNRAMSKHLALGTWERTRDVASARWSAAAPSYTRAETGRWSSVCGLRPNPCAWRRAGPWSVPRGVSPPAGWRTALCHWTLVACTLPLSPPYLAPRTPRCRAHTATCCHEWLVHHLHQRQTRIKGQDRPLLPRASRATAPPLEAARRAPLPC
jgi:hypothetical protein